MEELEEKYGDYYDFTNAKNHEYEDIFEERFLKRRSVSYLYSIVKLGSLEGWFESQTPFQVKDKVSWRECYEYAVKHGGRNLKGIINDLKAEITEQGNELIPEV